MYIYIAAAAFVVLASAGSSTDSHLEFAAAAVAVLPLLADVIILLGWAALCVRLSRGVYEIAPVFDGICIARLLLFAAELFRSDGFVWI